MRVKDVIFATKKPQSIYQSLILSLKKAVDYIKRRLKLKEIDKEKKRNVKE